MLEGANESHAQVDGFLRPPGLAEFRRTHYLRSPFGWAGTARSCMGFSPWDVLDTIFAGGHPDCWLPEDGRLPEAPELRSGRLTSSAARAGFAEGRTILVRHAERAHTGLRELASVFEQTFAKPIDIQLYYTPAGARGFSWHYDLEEVFVLHCRGTKTFELRQNTVVQRPLPRPLPKDLGYERERSTRRFECTVAEGDVLYIPSGFWHRARAVTDSFHLSVGVMALPEA